VRPVLRAAARASHLVRVAGTGVARTQEAPGYNPTMPLAAVLTLGLLLSGPSIDDVRGAVRQVLDDPSIQQEYPTGPAVHRAGGSDSGPTRRKGARQVPAREDERAPRVESGSGSPWFESLFWVAAGVAVLLLVVGFVRRVRGYTADTALPAAADEGPAAEETAPAPLADAEALARAGRYDEAVHVLLLLALERIGRQARLATSWTSREAIEHSGLGTEARTAVAALADAVEISRFGGRPVNEARYLACADHYRRFAAVGAGA